MDQSQVLVQEFQETFGHPVAQGPTAMAPDRALARMTWTAEECIEFLAASVTNKEDFAKLYYAFEDGMKKAYMKSLDGEFPQTEEDIIVAQTDALADQSYFVNGSAVEIGIDLGHVTGIVHASNMSKLFTDDNGNKYVKYDENNGMKVMKSPEFFPPEENLRAYIQAERQSVLEEMLKAK